MFTNDWQALEKTIERCQEGRRIEVGNHLPKSYYPLRASLSEVMSGRCGHIAAIDFAAVNDRYRHDIWNLCLKFGFQLITYYLRMLAKRESKPSIRLRKPSASPLPVFS